MDTQDKINHEISFLLQEVKENGYLNSPAAAKLYSTMYGELSTLLAAWSSVRMYDLTEEEIDDVITNTFFKVIDKIHTYKAQASILTWCFMIAKNKAIDVLRKHRSEHMKLISLEELSDENENINLHNMFGVDNSNDSFVNHLEEIEEKRVLSDFIHTFLNNLNTQEEKVLNLVFSEATNTEIAEILGVSRARISQIRKSIKEKGKKFLTLN